MHFVCEIPWESSLERSGEDREAAQHTESRMESNLGARLLLRGEASKPSSWQTFTELLLRCGGDSKRTLKDQKSIIRAFLKIRLIIKKLLRVLNRVIELFILSH